MAGKNLIEQFEESSVPTTNNTNVGLVGRSSDETPQLPSATTVSSTNTSKPTFKFGKSKVGDVNLPQERTVDEDRGFVRFEPQLQFERKVVAELVRTTFDKPNVKLSGKYAEVNYITIDLANFSELATGVGNIFIPLPKTPKPPTPPIPEPVIIDNVPKDEPTDSGPSNVQVNTLSSAEGTATVTQTNYTGQYPPFGVSGYPGEFRITPDGRMFIWLIVNGTGNWRPYEPGSGGGAASTSGGVGDGGAATLGDVGGGSGGTGLGGGTGNVNPDGSPGNGRPNVIPQ
jgi:hypothetical protein